MVNNRVETLSNISSNKYFTLNLVVVAIATVAGLYIYHDLLKRQYLNMGGLNKMDDTNIEIPKLKYEITTCEYDDSSNLWNPVLTHTFYGNSEDDIIGIIDSHRQTDAFFDASFSGKFDWKGGTIILKNTYSDITSTK